MLLLSIIRHVGLAVSRKQESTFLNMWLSYLTYNQQTIYTL